MSDANKPRWPLTTRAGTMQAWEAAKAMQPGEAEDKFRERFKMKKREAPTIQVSSVNTKRISPKFAAKLARMRVSDPEAAAQVEQLLAESGIEK